MKDICFAWSFHLATCTSCRCCGRFEQVTCEPLIDGLCSINGCDHGRRCSSASFPQRKESDQVESKQLTLVWSPCRSRSARCRLVHLRPLCRMQRQHRRDIIRCLLVRNPSSAKRFHGRQLTSLWNPLVRRTRVHGLPSALHPCFRLGSVEAVVAQCASARVLVGFSAQIGARHGCCCDAFRC